MSTTGEQLARRSIRAAESGLGQCGAQLLTTAASTGKFGAIQCISDGNLTTAGSLTLSSLPLKTGTIIYGRFTSATASANNKFIAYNMCE